MDREPGTTLTIDELVLRPWRPADAPELFAVCQDPEIVGGVIGIPQPFTAADADAFIESALAMWRDGTGATFAIVDAATDRLLGAVTRFGPDGHQARSASGEPQARGRGVGTRALRLVAEWTFDTTAAIRLDTFIMVGNEASKRMVERAGFRREGVLRAWDLHHDGVPVDCAAFRASAATSSAAPAPNR